MTATDAVRMSDLLDFRKRFDACMMEVGQPPPKLMKLSADGWLEIKYGESTVEWISAAIQALRISAGTFEPAIRLLEATERELSPSTCEQEASYD